MKPRLHKHLDIWFCSNSITTAYGLTPKEAYDKFILMYDRVIKELMFKLS